MAGGARFDSPTRPLAPAGPTSRHSVTGLKHVAAPSTLSAILRALGPQSIGPKGTCPFGSGRSILGAGSGLIPTGSCVSRVNAVRELVSRHFDVVVVIWVLTLAIGWSLIALSRASLPEGQWSAAPHNGPAWVYTDGGTAQ